MKKSATDATRVMIVDDHPIMRAGLKQLLAQEEDLEVCGEAEDAVGALRVVEQTNPGVIIVDISLRDSSGLELIKDLRIRFPHLPVLVLSMHEEAFYAERALRAGAKGYVTKAEVAARIVEAVRRVLSGQVYVSEKLADRLLGRIVAGGGSGPVGIESLSDREFEVFELIGQGLELREIAARLHLSIKTVEAHRENIRKKLDLPSSAELFRYAVQWTQYEKGS